MDFETDSAEILKIHANYYHKKNIMKQLNDASIKISKHKLKQILDTCSICKMYDIKLKSRFNLIKTSFVGERVACDILVIKNNVMVLNLIYYFSRKLYSKYISSKKPGKVIDFFEMFIKI
ncbi:hypothetical protein DMUE_1338 [Dictyocoela muelleri]|nr:hypothetical protein DMUE_1338 [Dictyocoela muelleri]